MGHRTLALVFAAMVSLSSSGASVARAQEKPATAPPRPTGPIIPKPEPLKPAPFTLEDRYLDAARRGDRKVLELSLEKGADLRAKDSFGRSALLLAARDAHSLELVKLLQERGLPVDEPDTSGGSALSYAAGPGQLELVEYLLAQGAQVDRKNMQGQTPLFHAVLIGNQDTAARLIAAGADVNVRDRFGDTPLMGACAKGFEDIARLLIEKGADPSLKDQEGRTARERVTGDGIYCRELPTGAQAPAPAPH